MMDFSCATLDFSETGHLTGIINSYLNKEGHLKPFFAFTPDAEGLSRALENRQFSFDRNLLAEIITGQNAEAGITPSEKVYNNIELLKNENTFTVTTGHQLCIFTGPLYFIYKIISTINLAEQLKEQHPDKNFVPVFWLAGEDHDFEEVNHIHLFNKTITWNPESAVKGPVGKLSPSTLSGEIEQLKQVMGDNENAARLYDLFVSAYQNTNTLSEATRYLVNEFFSAYGLVCIDGDDKRFKEILKPVMHRDIFNNEAHEKIRETIENMSAHGLHKIQVNPREINFFYMKPGLRERIEFYYDDEYRVLNTDIIFSREELEKEIEEHPEHFSPNVAIRPLFQEMILPNIAYVGGGGELAYWLELKAMFDHFKVDFPVLMLRNSLLWIDAISAERIKKLELHIAELFEETDLLVKKYVATHSEKEISIEIQENALKNIYGEIAEIAFEVDPTLKPAVEADLQRSLQALKHLENKIIKAEKNRFETAIKQITKLREKLFPENGLQERHDNFIALYIKHGDDFFSVLKNNLDPLRPEFIVLNENC